MTYFRALLWILFLLLAGKTVGSWDHEAGFERMEAQFQSSLLRVAATHTRLTERAAQAAQPKADGQPNSSGPELSGPPPATTQDPWPTGQNLSLAENPRIQIVAEDEEEKKWLYRSENFDFVSNAPLRQHVIREFAALFELTHLYCHELPLNLTRTQEKEKLQIVLIEDYTHYIARGGMQGSAGVYLSDVDLVMVPFDGLGLKQRNGSYSLDVLRTNQTLMHEATHMLMRGPLLRDGWFVEGAAEYVATVPIGRNSLLLSNHFSAVKTYVTSVGYKGRGGHGLGRDITLKPLKDFMEGDYENYQATPNAYPYALLLFYYFAHFDGEGDGQRLKDYVQALHDGVRNDTARELLLAGRSYRTLQTLLTNSWGQHGITLTFRK